MRRFKSYALGVAATLGTIATISDSLPKIAGAGQQAVGWFFADGAKAGVRPAVEAAPASVLHIASANIRALDLGPSCEALWLERNRIFDLHGYCFNSKLGQSVFDNADCRPVALRLPETDRQRVSALSAQESNFGCSIDTARVTMTVPSNDGSVDFGNGGRRFDATRESVVAEAR